MSCSGTTGRCHTNRKAPWQQTEKQDTSPSHFAHFNSGLSLPEQLRMGEADTTGIRNELDAIRFRNCIAVIAVRHGRRFVVHWPSFH
eukprot:4280996-Amphidinium_carterae.1